MKTLHNIVPSEATFWATSDGREIPFRELSRPHLSNILMRFSAKYLKGELRGDREKMFENAILEWNRRHGNII